MASRKTKCPGCHELKSNHSFGTPGKDCEGWQPSGVDEDKPTSTELAILKSIRHLSQQFERMEIEQNLIKEKLNCKETDEKASLTPAPALPGTNRDLTGAASQSSITTITLTEKQERAIAGGEYIDLADLLSMNMITQHNIGVLETASGETINVLKPQRKRTIDSFDTWLQAWNIYEQKIMEKHPQRYFELARYRESIQMANRKFRWANVYMFDMQSRKQHCTKNRIYYKRKYDVNLDDYICNDFTLYANASLISYLLPM